MCSCGCLWVMGEKVSTIVNLALVSHCIVMGKIRYLSLHSSNKLFGSKDTTCSWKALYFAVCWRAQDKRLFRFIVFIKLSHVLLC